MADNSVDYHHHQPLLLKKDDDDLGCLKKTSFLVSSLKLFLKISIWAIFIAWAAFMFLLPLNYFSHLERKWREALEGTLFGITGGFI